jgi:hypothetical protein
MPSPNKQSWLALLFFYLVAAMAALSSDAKGQSSKFRDLNEILAPPNSVRTASGAPGPNYWQQRADYRMQVRLDEEHRRVEGRAVITYHNHSPDILSSLWMHLDLNRYSPDSDLRLGASTPVEMSMGYREARLLLEPADEGAGMKVTAVSDQHGRPMPHDIHGTLMRVDLPEPLLPGGRVLFSVEWNCGIPNYELSGRVGYESFDDGHDSFALGKFYPRMAAYTDARGWHTRQFLGTGEFTLEFGDFEVEITVPEDHIVAATGELQHPERVLTPEQRERLEAARHSDRPVFIATPEEAEAREKQRAAGTRAWLFKAENVRDFAFASSRKFVWDAMGHRQEGDPAIVMAMSFYPREGMPLWDKYSTHAIAHALEVYSEFTFPYPYPVAQSVMTGIKLGGMEFPMITFNGPRPERDKETGEVTYSREEKNLLIAVVIHEIGHQYFPMTINSDERQWAWLDEGLTEFIGLLAEERWEEGFFFYNRRHPHRWASVLNAAAAYMSGPDHQPIMTRSDAVIDPGSNAYTKPAVALMVLRETVMGRERFDRAFKEYARRWKFKRANPADFFRTMNDAGGMDLDWFWHGWFFTADHLEFKIEDVSRISISSQNPKVESAWRRAQAEKIPGSLIVVRDRAEGRPLRVDRFPELRDFYNEHDEDFVTNEQMENYEELLGGLEPWQRELLSGVKGFYRSTIANKGGLIAPVILRYEHADGSFEEVRHPAEIWRRSPDRISVLHATDKEVRRVIMDPHWELPLASRESAAFPRSIEEKRIDLTPEEIPRNLMREVLAKPAGENATSGDQLAP